MARVLAPSSLPVLSPARVSAVSPGLGNGDEQGVPVHQGVPVAELGAQVHLHRDAAEVFYQGFAHHGGVKRRAAGQEKNLADLLELLVREDDLLEHHFPQVGVDAPPKGVNQGPGLLKDLFLHEMFVAGLLRHGRTPGDGVLRALDAPPFLVQQVKLPVPHHHEVMVFQKNHPAGVGQDGGNVRGQKVFAVPQPQDQRAFLPGRHQHAGLVGVDDGQGVGTLDLVDGPLHRRQIRRPLLQVLDDEVGDDLRVCLRGKAVTGLDQLCLEFQVVLDDAVVHHRDVARPGGDGRWSRRGARAWPSGCGRCPPGRGGALFAVIYPVPPVSRRCGGWPAPDR